MQGKLFLISLVLSLIFLPGFVSAGKLQCRVVNTACGEGETDVLHMSDLFNAHAELANQTAFSNPYKVCCSGPAPLDLGTDCLDPDHGTLFWLQDVTNSHVNKTSSAEYDKEVCISGTLIGCDYGLSCEVMGPAGGATCLVSVSADMNAHIGNCTGDDAYGTKVCCWMGDITPPTAWITIIDRYMRTNPEWVNWSEDALVFFNVSWNGSDDVIEQEDIIFNIRYRIYNRSSDGYIDDCPGTIINHWCDWLLDKTGPGSQGFGPVEPLTHRYYDNSTFQFRINATDNAGNVFGYDDGGPRNTTIDTIAPEIIDIMAKDDKGRVITDPVMKADETGWVNISSNVTDSISGVMEHSIEYFLTQNDVMIHVFACGETSYGEAPPFGGLSSCYTGKINYIEDTVIKYRVKAVDRAFNTIWSEPWSYVATHPMVNFIIHSLYLTLGDSFDLDVQVRNLQPAFDNITLEITKFPGYITTTFLDTGVGNLTAEGQGWVLEDIGLNPNEEKTVKIRVVSSGIGPVDEDPYIYVNATSMLNATGEPCGMMGAGECLKDSDEAMVVVGYPAAFPGLSWWAIFILVTLAVVVYSAVPIRKK